MDDFADFGVIYHNLPLVSDEQLKWKINDVIYDLDMSDEMKNQFLLSLTETPEYLFNISEKYMVWSMDQTHIFIYLCDIENDKLTIVDLFDKIEIIAVYLKMTEILMGNQSQIIDGQMIDRELFTSSVLIPYLYDLQRMVDGTRDSIFGDQVRLVENVSEVKNVFDVVAYNNNKIAIKWSPFFVFKGIESKTVSLQVRTMLRTGKYVDSVDEIRLITEAIILDYLKNGKLYSRIGTKTC